MNIAIIGGGAAGFFAAIAAKENYPDYKVVIFEKAQKVLSKVKVSGGGRCNVTNSCSSNSQLSKAYPRGEKCMKKAFQVFDNRDAMAWFQSRGVPLVIQDDNCVFPKSQDSQSIIDCFLRETKRLGITIELGMGVKQIIPFESGFILKFIDEKCKEQRFDKVVVTTGGTPKQEGLEWLKELNHKIEPPIPSLFTFNMPSESITQLMGIVVENVAVNIQGTKIKAGGPLLITHWGMSGPAILKLSSYGARVLSDKNYNFKVQVNWVNEVNNQVVFDALQNIAKENPKKMLSTIKPFALPERLWLFLLQKRELNINKVWGEIGLKSINKLVSSLTDDIYEVQGKTTFRDEFVTCGGVSLQSIDINTMESRVCKNLYFAGEVLDIDAITGGFNLQAAWTTGFIAGKLQ